MEFIDMINSSHSSNNPSLFSLLHFLLPIHILGWINLQSAFAWSWPIHFSVLALSAFAYSVSLVLFCFPYLAVFASSAYDWAWNSGCSHGLLREQALYKDVMPRGVPERVISSWLCTCSRDAASLQIPIKVIIPCLLPGTKVKFKITAPTGGTWKTFPNLW